MQHSSSLGANPAPDISASFGTVPHLDRVKFAFDPCNPMHIHQHALDTTGDALRDDDFETFSTFFGLPHQIDTFTMARTITTRADMLAVFRNSRRQNEEAGVTERVRVCIAASFKRPDVITCSHVTRIMQGNHQLRDAIPCHSTFERIGDTWLLTRSSYAIEETDRPFDRLLTRKGKPLEFS